MTAIVRISRKLKRGIDVIVVQVRNFINYLSIKLVRVEGKEWLFILEPEAYSTVEKVMYFLDSLQIQKLHLSKVLVPSHLENELERTISSTRGKRHRWILLYDANIVASNIFSGVKYIALIRNAVKLKKNILRSIYRDTKKDNEQFNIYYCDEEYYGPNQTGAYKPDWSPHLYREFDYLGALLICGEKLFSSLEFNSLHQIKERIEKELLSRGAKHLPYIACEGGKVNRVKGETDKIAVKKALVSIIIPTKDKVELLGQCIESVVEKSADIPIEIIIINNRSKEKNTFEWFVKIKERFPFVRVVDADIEFNWSKLNNIGIREAKGDCFVFLNNDTQVITYNWLEPLIKVASEADVGIVGPLLLYEDLTIQHAGVVVGMSGFADHVYKGEAKDCESLFVSPLLTRNVLALTGACQMLSRRVIEKIGAFNEDFIICGSDIELCIRAYKQGLYNVYVSEVELFHYESKSRDSYIPPIDFHLSEIHYQPFLSSGDPFYNCNLSLMSTKPVVRGVR